MESVLKRRWTARVIAVFMAMTMIFAYTIAGGFSVNAEDEDEPQSWASFYADSASEITEAILKGDTIKFYGFANARIYFEEDGGYWEDRSFPDMEGEEPVSFEWEISGSKSITDCIEIEESGTYDSEAVISVDGACPEGDVKISMKVKYNGDVIAKDEKDFHICDSFRFIAPIIGNGEGNLYGQEGELLPGNTVTFKLRVVEYNQEDVSKPEDERGNWIDELNSTNLNYDYDVSLTRDATDDGSLTITEIENGKYSVTNNSTDREYVPAIRVSAKAVEGDEELVQRIELGQKQDYRAFFEDLRDFNDAGVLIGEGYSTEICTNYPEGYIDSIRIVAGNEWDDEEGIIGTDEVSATGFEVKTDEIEGGYRLSISKESIEAVRSVIDNRVFIQIILGHKMGNSVAELKDAWLELEVCDEEFPRFCDESMMIGDEWNFGTHQNGAFRTYGIPWGDYGYNITDVNAYEKGTYDEETGNGEATNVLDAGIEGDGENNWIRIQGNNSGSADIVFEYQFNDFAEDADPEDAQSIREEHAFAYDNVETGELKTFTHIVSVDVINKRTDLYISSKSGDCIKAGGSVKLNADYTIREYGKEDIRYPYCGLDKKIGFSWKLSEESEERGSLAVSETNPLECTVTLNEDNDERIGVILYAYNLDENGEITGEPIAEAGYDLFVSDDYTTFSMYIEEMELEASDFAEYGQQEGIYIKPEIKKYTSECPEGEELTLLDLQDLFGHQVEINWNYNNQHNTNRIENIELVEEGEHQGELLIKFEEQDEQFVINKSSLPWNANIRIKIDGEYDFEWYNLEKEVNINVCPGHEYEYLSGNCDDGYVYEKCTYCGKTVKTERSGHDYETINIVKAGKLSGVELKKCAVCGDIDAAIIAQVGELKLSKNAYTYTGEECKPQVTLYDAEDNIIPESEYDITYADNINAGTAKVILKMKGDKYDGTFSKSYTINKATPSLKISTSTVSVKYADVKKKATATSAVSVTGIKENAKKTYSKVSGSSPLTINSTTGKITVKKGTKKGTYSIKIKVSSKATTNYNSASVTKTIKVTVK